MQSIERLLPHQGVKRALRCHAPHDRQGVAPQRLPEPRSLPLGGRGPDDPRQEVESRFVHDNKPPALASRPPLQVGPEVSPPTCEGRLVPLDGPPERDLGRPTQFLEPTSDMVLMVTDAELLLDDPGDAGTGPDLAAEALGFGPVPQELGNPSLLRGGQLGLGSGTGRGPKSFHPGISATAEPAADGHLGDIQGVGDVLLNPALWFQLPGAQTSPFHPIMGCGSRGTTPLKVAARLRGANKSLSLR